MISATWRTTETQDRVFGAGAHEHTKTGNVKKKQVVDGSHGPMVLDHMDTGLRIKKCLVSGCGPCPSCSRPVGHMLLIRRQEIEWNFLQKMAEGGPTAFFLASSDE